MVIILMLIVLIAILQIAGRLILPKFHFDHSKTNFALIGQHINVDCKSCHESLVFSKMDKDCFSCHKDIHQGTVGLDCASCHTPTTWIVKDISWSSSKW